MKAGALIIGCRSFNDPSIAALNYAADDAERFKEVIVSFCGVDPSDVMLLASGLEGRRAPTRSIIISNVSYLEKHCIAGVTRMFLLLSGHGSYSNSTKEFYFLPTDTFAPEIDATGVSIEWILARLKNANLSQIFAFLDICRNTYTDRKSWATEELEYPDNLRGSLIIYSCKHNQKSYEVESLRAGLFTHALCSGISGVGSCNTASELCEYVKTQIPNLARQFDKPTQDPHIILEEDISVTVIVDKRTFSRRSIDFLIKHEIRPEPQTTVSEFAFSGTRPIAAVDFGTSKTIAALPGPRFIPHYDGKILIRSGVFVDKNLEFTVGDAAYKNSPTAPGRYIRDMKRHLPEPIAYKLEDLRVETKTCVSMVLSSIRRDISAYCGRDISDVVVSYPVNFTIEHLGYLISAFSLAGFNIVRAISEAAAAALAFQMSRREGGTVLIVDLGGGTLDTAIAEVGDGALKS
jgi:hypothetical protein